MKITLDLTPLEVKTTFLSFFEDLRFKQIQILTKLNSIMTALETLTQTVSQTSQNLTQLTAAVDNAIGHINTPGGATDQQLTTLNDTLTTLNAAIASNAQRLNDALGSAPAPVNNG